MDDLKIESLEKRIKELEKKNSLSLFGSSYSLIGSSNSDFLIKTRGKIKLQFGNKFIDLIKDGKLNVDAQFIYKSNEIGVKDGIYIIGDEVWLVSGNYKKNLVGEVGDTYVSFLAPLENTAEQKYQALLNIGFIYKSLLDVPEIQSGIVYIESEKKLYIIDKGVLTEFTIPVPFTELFIIQKNNSDKGSLVVKGLGIENSITIDSMYIYTANNQSTFDSTNDVCVRINNKDYVILSVASSQFLNTVVSQLFQSQNATSDFGFRLYMVNGESILEVDKVVARLATDKLDIIYPKYWFGDINVVKKIKINESTSYDITLNQESTFILGDTLIVYLLKNDTEIITLTPIELTISGINGNLISVQSNKSLTDIEINSLIGKHLYKIKSLDNTFLSLTLEKNSLYISKDDIIKTKIGNISDVVGEENSYGIYTDNLKLGGLTEDNLPKYLLLLATLLHSLNVKDTTLYDTVLVSIGLLKIFIQELVDRIEALEQRMDAAEQTIQTIQQTVETIQLTTETIQLDVVTMLQTIETMLQDIDSLKPA